MIPSNYYGNSIRVQAPFPLDNVLKFINSNLVDFTYFLQFINLLKEKYSYKQ